MKKKNRPLKRRSPMPKKPPKVMPHGKDYRRRPKHKRPYQEGADA